MSRKNTLILFCFLLSLGFHASAQSVRFSQFQNMPQRLNPALVGVFEGKFRAAAIYRSQWASVSSYAWTSYALSAEYKFLGLKNDHFALGGCLMSDKAGTNAYGVTEFNLNLSYHKMLGKPKAWKKGANYLIAGLQLGAGQRRIEPANIQTSVQFDGDGFDNSASTGELLTNNNSTKMYPDFGLGLLYYTVMGERKSFYGGLAINHLNRPDISFGTANRRDPLLMKMSFHAGGEIPFGRANKIKPISMLPSVLVMMQGPAMEVNVGSAFRYKKNKKDDFAFRIGGFFRGVATTNTAFAPEAVILNVGLEIGTLNFGFSYDATLSNLSQANGGRGAFEASVIYVNPNKRRRYDGCPTF
jgi:type IX secretion system PorP/SprF family membrane protein